MRFSEDKIETLICSDGNGRSIHVWEPEKPEAAIIAIHGAMAHGGDFVTPALYFKEHGFVTLAQDLHGHDAKEKVFIPRFEVFLDDVERMIAHTKTKYQGLPIIIMGHSMGALIATHFGLRRLREDPFIKGFVLSSPYFVNVVKASPVLLKVASLLSVLLPKIVVPIEDITPFLTHDPTISSRHKADERDHIRASHVSARFANEVLKAQKYIPGHIESWSHPLFCVVAGDDHIADFQSTLHALHKIDKKWVDLHIYPENYHENLNELNREEIFTKILDWMNRKMG